MKRLALAILTGATAFVAAAPSQACSIFVPRGYKGSDQHRRDVRAAITSAAAIIDGEVVRPGSYGQSPALVYAHRVLKGPDRRWFTVGTNESDSCAVELNRPGERMRLILSGGPAEFVLYRDQSDARMEDAMLNSDRRKTYPYYPGRRGSVEKR